MRWASKRSSLSANVALVVDNFILSVSLLTADIFNGIFPYVRNSAEWQKRSVWGVKYVNLLSWAAPEERPRHTPTRRIKEMLMLANLCAFLWFCWIETDVFPLIVPGAVPSIVLCSWVFNIQMILINHLYTYVYNIIYRTVKSCKKWLGHSSKYLSTSHWLIPSLLWSWACGRSQKQIALLYTV